MSSKKKNAITMIALGGTDYLFGPLFCDSTR